MMDCGPGYCLDPTNAMCVKLGRNFIGKARGNS